MLIRNLTPELQKKAEKELNETPSRIKDDLYYIKEWVKTQQHLNVRMDNQWLISFLRGCKFSLQRTKEKIDYFYTTRTLLPEYFNDRDPFTIEIQEMLKAGVFFPLMERNGTTESTIFILRFDICDPNKMTVPNLAKVYLMAMDILMNEDDKSVISGIRIWVDLSQFNINYLLQLTPSFIKKILSCIERAYPLRIKGIHLTNMPSVFERILNLIKSLMSKKLRNRLRVYNEGSFDKIYRDIPKRIVPKEFGGNGESTEILSAHWKRKMEDYRNWFLEDCKYRTNEQLRSGLPKTSAELYGVEGSFRKLTVD